MRVLILANGDPPPLEQLEHERKRSDAFYATDGAANYLMALGIMPTSVLGDFDSLSPQARKRFDSIMVEAFDQEACDLDKAIEYAINRGADSVRLLGVSGGRTDHALTAVSLLVKYHRVIDICIINGGETVRALSGECVVHGGPGDTLSLVAFDRAEGVCEKGVRWPLTDAVLEPGSRGVSNQILSGEAHISIKSGVVILCHTRINRQGL